MMLTLRLGKRLRYACCAQCARCGYQCDRKLSTSFQTNDHQCCMPKWKKLLGVSSENWRSNKTAERN